MTDTNPVLKVAQNLSAIIDLTTSLEAQAVNKADDHDLPGGAAMVALGPVASPEAWENVYEHREKWNRTHRPDEHRDVSHVADEIEDEAPVLQTLLFWSEAWRVEHGWQTDQRPTIVTEASFIRHCLDWAWDNELHWDDFARDMGDAKSQLENIVAAGVRSRHGVQCFDCNVALVRTSRDPRTIHHCAGHDGICVWPHRFCPHDRGGLSDDWHCPACHRSYDVESYWRAVRHAHFVYADYLPLLDCAERTGVKPGTIKVWATREKVRKHRAVDSGRVTYNVADVQAQNTQPADVA